MKRCLLLFLASLAFLGTFSQTLRPDPAFGQNGLATTSSVANFSCATVQSNGKVVAAVGSGSGLTVVRLNADGTLDNTFGTNGTAFVNVSGSIPWPYIGSQPASSYGSPSANSVAVNKDGQIAVVGSVMYGGGWTSTGFGYVAAFLNADGTPAGVDVRVNPYYTGDIYTSKSSASSVTVQNDGKFVVLGEEQLISGLGSIRGTEFIVARYSTNASLEREVRTSIPRNIRFVEGQMHAYSIAIQSNGQIVVAGEGGNDTAPLLPPIESLGRVLLRYSADLTLDNTFGSVGIAYTSFLINFSDRTIAVQNDGKIVAVGTNSSGLAIARFNANGSLDSSFGNGGTVSTGLPSGTYIPSLPPLVKKPSSVNVQDDGKIIASAGSGSTFSIARLNTDGSFDNTFDGDGIASTTVNMSIANTLISPNRVYAVGSSQGMGAVAAFLLSSPCTPPTFLNNGFIVLNAECGKSNGNISLIPLTGTAPFQYSIDGGTTYVSGPDQGLTFYDLAKGTYQLRMKDASGCQSDVVAKEVKAPDCPLSCTPPTFLNNSMIVKAATCGQSDGALYVIPTSGTAPFLYSKDGGATYVSGPDAGYTFQNLAPGTYQLRIKDAGGCESAVVTRQIRSVYGGPTFLNDGTIVRDASCGMNDGNITIVPTSGTAPFMYSNNDGVTYVAGPASGYTFSNLAAGNYWLRLKDANGCESQSVLRYVRPNAYGACATTTVTARSRSVAEDKEAVVRTYPNPSKGVFRLQFSGLAAENVQLTILDATGALVQQKQLNVQKGSTIEVDLSSKAKGLYLIRVVSDKGTQQTKVLLQ